MSCKKTDDRKNVVIVGGGAVGQPLARTLSKKLNPSTHNLILIDRRPFHIFLPPALRLVTSDVDNLQTTSIIPHDKLFVKGNGTFIEGKVTSIQKGDRDRGSLTLENGDVVEFELLVLASGSGWEGPLDFPDKKEGVIPFIESIRKRIKDANDIVLAGGGCVGIELAGEIKDIYPDKNVTIVKSRNHLLTDVYPLKYRTRVEQGLVKRGVTLVLNDYIDDIPTGTFNSVNTRSGKTIKADAVFKTRGGRPHTEFINSLGPDILTERGLVKVRPTLQLASYDDIYAAGDIVDYPEEKQLLTANAHSRVIIANIMAAIAKKPLTVYKGSPLMILLTNGRNAGVTYFGILWGIVFGDWLVRLIHPKNLLLRKARAVAGY